MSAVSILILTQPECAFCDAAKAMFERLSREYPLLVSMVALGSTEGAYVAQRSGVLFPPGIFIDGKPFSYGRPSERKIRRAIEQRLQEASRRAHERATQ